MHPVLENVDPAAGHPAGRLRAAQTQLNLTELLTLCIEDVAADAASPAFRLGPIKLVSAQATRPPFQDVSGLYEGV